MPIAAIMAIAGILLMFNPNAEPLTKEQKVMQGTYLGVHAIDWGQTLYASERQSKYNEDNPILGPDYGGSRGEINRYMASSSILHTGITKSLPSKYRKYWQMFTIGFEVGVVHQNAQIGVRMDF